MEVAVFLPSARPSSVVVFKFLALKVSPIALV